LNKATSGVRRLEPSALKLKSALFGPRGAMDTDAVDWASAPLPANERRTNSTNLLITASFEPEA
jgi:hypothetical protein